MLNKEKYETEIYRLCVGTLDMDDFMLKTGYKGYSFVSEFKAWANSEYVEPFKITQAEKVILENLDPEYTLIKRDHCGDLKVFDSKRDYFYTFYMFGNLFKFIEKNSIYEIKYILENCEVIDDAK